MCTGLQKSWLTTPTLDRWNHGMDWDQWSGFSSGRSWLLERDKRRRRYKAGGSKGRTIRQKEDSAGGVLTAGQQTFSHPLTGLVERCEHR